jgi:hypothetical protein
MQLLKSPATPGSKTNNNNPEPFESICIRVPPIGSSPVPTARRLEGYNPII